MRSIVTAVDWHPLVFVPITSKVYCPPTETLPYILNTSEPTTSELNPLGRLSAAGILLFLNLILISEILESTQIVWSAVLVELRRDNSAFAWTVITPLSSGLSQPWLFRALTV